MPMPPLVTPHGVGGAPSAELAATPAAGGNLRGIIIQKEKELHDINEYRLQTLETLLSEKEREIADGKQRLTKLKDDFTYNLKLLEERDSELVSQASPPGKRGRGGLREDGFGREGGNDGEGGGGWVGGGEGPGDRSPPPLDCSSCPDPSARSLHRRPLSCRRSGTTPRSPTSSP